MNVPFSFMSSSSSTSKPKITGPVDTGQGRHQYLVHGTKFEVPKKYQVTKAVGYGVFCSLPVGKCLLLLTCLGCYMFRIIILRNYFTFSFNRCIWVCVCGHERRKWPKVRDQEVSKCVQ